MDRQTLQTTIAKALTGTQFSLDSSVFGTAPTPVSEVFSAFLQGTTLELTAAFVDTSGTAAIAKGTLSAAPNAAYKFVSGFQVDASFTVDANTTVQLTLTLTPPTSQLPNWGLPDAMPGYQNSLFKAFNWSNAQLVFDSQTPAQLPATFPTAYGFPANSTRVEGALAKGMRFHADVTYQGADEGLKWFVGDGPVTVSGPVEWDGDQPRLDLASKTLSALAVGPFTLPIDLHCVAVLLESVAADGKTAVVHSMPLGILHGQLGMPHGSPDLVIPFYVELYSDPAGQVRVIGDFAEASSLGLQEVAGLLGVGSLDHQQAPGFPTLEGLALKTVTLTVQAAQQQLISASATVEYTPPGGAWEPFGGDLLSFNALDVTFTAFGPFSAPSVTTCIDCKATLADGSLDAWVNLPSLEFACELQDGETKPVDLTKILDTITGGAFTKLTPDFKLLCTELAVLGNRTAGLYRFQATVKDNWAFDALGAKFALESIGFDISHQTGATATTTGQVVAMLVVAGVEVRISAEYDGTGQGWKFSGGTTPDQDISLTALVDDALTHFGLSLPAKVPAVSITGIQMQLNTGNMDFGFSCDGKIDFAGLEMDLGIDLGRTHDDPVDATKVTTTFMGYLEVGDQYFEVDFTSGDSDKKVSFSWLDEGKPLGFNDIAKGFGFNDVPEIPSSLDLALTEASVSYDFTDKTIVVTAQSKNYGAAIFVGDMLDRTTRFYGFGIDIPLNIVLANIPLVGSKIPDADNLGIPSAGAWILSTALTKPQAEAVNQLVPSAKYPTLPDDAVNARVVLHALLALGTEKSVPIVLPLGGGTTTAGGGVAATAPSNGTSVTSRPGITKPVASPGGDGTQWLDIQKQFGIFDFKRIGVGYHDNVLMFSLDAGMTLGPLTMSMDGLSIASPLTKFDPTFDIRGLGLAYNKPPLEIEGALLKLASAQLDPGVKFQFDGLAVVKAADFGLAAIASYAQLEIGDPSLFVFAQLEAPLGDPTGTGALFITGVMGGFGLNRSLAIPAQDEVCGFPLLVLGQPPQPGQNAAAQDPMHVLAVLDGSAPITPGGTTKEWIAPSPGDYWLGVGLEFTSWELVNTKAVLIVEFGHDLVFALLGLSTMQLPQPSESSETYAFVELGIEAVLKPLDGFFGLSAVLSDNSYVLTPDCHLTGGFAFYVWFGPNEHAGQFVVTLGGYHPAFKPPSFFPQEKRLGFNWAVSSVVSISGGAYFALTPSCIMAGGGLDVLFHDGNLRAWFIAHADFLVSWRPFFFTAEIGVSIGVSYRLNLLVCHKTISLSVGADVSLWGPPTGGTVHVHLWIVSFTVRFGSDSASANDTAIGWSDFQDLLPPSKHVCKVVATDGVYKSLDAPPLAPADGTNPNSTKIWVVRAKKFCFYTQSAIPAGNLVYGPANASLQGEVGRANEAPATATGTSSETIDVRPMNLTGVTSTHRLQIFQGKDANPIPTTGWRLEPRLGNVPKSLWGTPSAPFHQVPAAPTSEVIGDQPVGYVVHAPPPVLGFTAGIVPLASLAEEFIAPDGQAPINPGASASPNFVPTVDPTSMGQIAEIAGNDATANRNALFAAMTHANVFAGSNGSVAEMGKQAAHLYADAPLVQN